MEWEAGQGNKSFSGGAPAAGPGAMGEGGSPGASGGAFCGTGSGPILA